MSKLSTLLSQSVSLVSSISRHFGFSSMQCGTQLKLDFRWAWDKPVPAAFIYDPSPPNGCAINSNANFRTTGVYIVYIDYTCYCFGVDHLQRDASIKLASFLDLGTRLVFIRSCGKPERAAHRWHTDLACPNNSISTGFVSQGSYTGMG